MNYVQLVAPNVEINEEAGLCLSYSRRTFGAPVVERTAWEAWLKALARHEDRNFPAGVAVPVFFDWWGQLPADKQKYQYGHVAVRTPDGKIWSSPLSGRGRAVFDSVDELVKAFGGGMRYVGWTEDISTIKVVGGNMVQLSDEEFKDLQQWKQVGIDALAFKDGVVNSKAWSNEMGAATDNITPVLNDLSQFKKDHINDAPSDLVQLDGPVFIKKK